MLEGMLAVIPAAGASLEGGGVRQRLEEAKALQQRVMLVLQSGLLSRFLQ
jgi:hypothetical protein